MFQRKKVDAMKLIPLALAMIFNVVLPNASLAYSSIQFYQVVRVLLTPCVVLLNYLISRATIPAQAALTLIPVCAGVAIVSYFDVSPKAGSRGTSLLGVFFAFSGVFASSIYTVWIARYHKILECTSMQLLLNQAPVSVLIMLYIIPFSDDITIWQATPLPTWLLIGFVCLPGNRTLHDRSLIAYQSGILACLINLSQFMIIHEAGPVSSTVVGHFKTCSIIMLGWIHSRKPLSDGSLVGIVLAVGGIILCVQQDPSLRSGSLTSAVTPGSCKSIHENDTGDPRGTHFVAPCISLAVCTSPSRLPRGIDRVDSCFTLALFLKVIIVSYHLVATSSNTQPALIRS